jgi:hypothetical protein
VEFIIVVGVLFLLWLLWQLARAKRFTRFKHLIVTELKPQVIASIIEELEQTRSEQYPNNQAHQDATILYWSSSKAKILQAALLREIIDEQWLKDSGNLRNSQHLFYIEKHLMHQTNN